MEKHKKKKTKIIVTIQQYHNQSKNYEKAMRYINMGFTGMFSVETVLKIMGFGVKVCICSQLNLTSNPFSIILFNFIFLFGSLISTERRRLPCDSLRTKSRDV